MVGGEPFFSFLFFSFFFNVKFYVNGMLFTIQFINLFFIYNFRLKKLKI